MFRHRNDCRQSKLSRPFYDSGLEAGDSAGLQMRAMV
jgi:hypothetical protein